MKSCLITMLFCSLFTVLLPCRESTLVAETLVIVQPNHDSPIESVETGFADLSELDLLTTIRNRTDESITELKSKMQDAETEAEIAILGRQINILEQQCALELLNARIMIAVKDDNTALVAELTSELRRLEQLLRNSPSNAHSPEEIRVKPGVKELTDDFHPTASNQVVTITKPSEPVQIESAVWEPSEVQDGGER